MSNSDIRVGITIRADGSAQVTGDLDRIRNGLRSTGDAAQGANREFAALAKTLISSLGLGALAGNILQINREMQSLRTSLETVTGSAGSAKKAFEEIQSFAKQTPYSVKEVTEAFINLSNYGLKAGAEALTSYGNTASAMGKSLDQMIQAVADATTGEFERLKEFGILASKQGDAVTFTFKGIETTVKNSSQNIQDYLQQIGNTDFAGGMAKQAATIDGAISNLGDSWDQFIDGLINSSGEQAIAQFILQLADNLAAVGNAALSAATGLTAYAAAQMLIASTGSLAAKVLAMLRTALLFIAGINPFALVVGGITSAITATYLYRDAVVSVGQSTATVGNVMESAWLTVRNAATDAIYDISASFPDLSAAARTSSAFIGEVFSNAWRIIKDLAGLTVDSVVGLFNGMGAALGVAAAGIVDVYTQSFEKIKSLAGGLASGIEAALSGNIDFADFNAALKMKVKSFADVGAEMGAAFSGGFASAQGTTERLGQSFDSLWNEVADGANTLHALDTMVNANADSAGKLANKNTALAASHNSAGAAAKDQATAAKAAADEAKRNYDQAIKSSVDYIKRLKDETAQIGMNATQRADFAAEQIAATMADSKVRSEAIVKFLNEAHELAAALEKVKEAEKADEAFKAELDVLIDQYKQLTLSAEEYYKWKLSIINLNSKPSSGGIQQDQAGISDEQKATLVRQFNINKSIQETKKRTDEARSALEQYSSTVSTVSENMQSLGDITGAIFDGSLGGVNRLVGAMENMVKGIEESKKGYAALAAQKKQIDDFQPSLDKDQYLRDIKIKYDAQQKYEIDYQNLQAQTFDMYMDGTRQMAGALTSMFEDNKTAQLANQAVALVTLGIQAVQAIVTQGQGDPYTAFARIAAMAAIVGAMVSSVGGKSPKPGSAPGGMVQSKTTGTVLGDKDTSSKSVQNIIKTLEDIHADEYAELRGINDGIRSLAAGITSTVTRVFQNGGFTQPVLPAGKSGFVNNVAGFLIPKKTTYSLNAQGIYTDPFQIGQQVTGQQYDVIEKKVKSLFSTKTSYFTIFTALQDNVTAGLTDVFNSIGETMLTTSEALGKFIGSNLQDRVLQYVIPSLTIDLKGLNAEDASKKVNAVISTALDNMATSVFGDIIGQYQQLGEGMLETAIRLVSEIAVVGDALMKSGLELDPENVLVFSDAIIQMAGSIQEFQKQFSQYIDSFYSDKEKFNILSKQLFGNFEKPKNAYGSLLAPKSDLSGQISAVFHSPEKLAEIMGSRAGYRSQLEKININTEWGMKQYATLIKLAPMADQYYSYIESKEEERLALEEKRHDLELQLMDATGQSAEALAERRKKELAAMDESLRPLQEQIYLAQDNLILQQEAQKLAQQQRGLDIQYMQATGNAAGALAAKREDELAAMEESLRPMQLAIYAAEDLLVAQQKAAEIAKQQRSLDIELMTAQGNTAGALAAKRADELAAMNESLKATQQAIYDAQDSAAAATALAEALKKEEEATEKMTAAAQLAAENLQAVSEILAVSGFILGSNANVLADSLAKAAGGLSELQSQFSTYFNGFYAETERQIINGNKLQTALSGLFDQATIDTMSKSREAYRQVLESLDLNNEADQQRYVLLLKLAGAANEYYTAIEASAAANAQAIEDSNQANADALAQYQEDLAQYNAEVAQQAADAAEQAAQAMAEAITNALQTVADNAKKFLDDAITALNDAVQKERDVITAKYNTDLEKATQAVDSLTTSVNNLKALSASLKSYMDRLATQNPTLQSRVQAQQQIATSLQNAKNGRGLPTADDLNNSLSVLAQPSENLFGTFVDYQRDFLKTSISINDLLTVTDAQTSKQVSALDIAQSQLEVLKTNFDKEMTRLDDMLKRGDDIVKGTDRTTSAVVSVEQALANLTKAVAQNNAAQAALEANKAANAAKQTTAAPTPPIAPTAPALTPVPTAIVPSSGFGTASFNNYTGTNVLGSAEAIPTTIADVYRQVLGREADPEGYTYWSNQLSSGAVTADNLAKTVATVAAAVTASDIANYEGAVSQDELMKSVINARAWLAAHSYAKGGDHEGGWAIVGERGPELVNLPPSRVFSHSDSKGLLSVDELLAEMKQLREEMKAGHVAIASNTKDTRKVLEKWDYDGAPAVRA